MRRYFLALSLLLATPSVAHAGEVAVWRVIGLGAKDSLPVRAEPDPKAAVSFRIPAKSGGIKNLRDCRNRPDEDAGKSFSPFWCKVEYKGSVGWATRANLAPDF